MIEDGRNHERRRELLPAGDGLIDVVIDELREPSGHEHRSAIVLLPSALRDSLEFDPLASLLAAGGFRVLRPQPRGMARSSGPPANLDLALLARDVVHTIDAFGGGRAVLVGHAFGHFVARVADLLHPDKVHGLVLAAAAARTFPAGMAEAQAIASDPSQPDATRLAQLRRAFFARGSDARPWLAGWYPQLRAAYRAAAASPPKSAWWPVSHAPILDLQGDEDPWRPPHTRDELQAALGSGQVEVKVVPHASHALPVEQPAAVAAAISAWTRALPP